MSDFHFKLQAGPYWLRLRKKNWKIVNTAVFGFVQFKAQWNYRWHKRCAHNSWIFIVKWTISEHTVWEECCSPMIKRCVHWKQTYPPSSAILRLSLNTGFKMYPCRPPCSCWLCQRRSPANTETHSSWSLQVETKKKKQINWIGYHSEMCSPPFSPSEKVVKSC